MAKTKAKESPEMAFDQGEKPLHIVEFLASNILRLKAVRIRPEDGEPVVIGGNNEQGKSSVLNAIEMALGGGKSIPEKPIHDGATKAEIILDLGDLKVERTFTHKGTNLKVFEKNAAGEWIAVASPQEMLNKLYARIALDPLEFERMDAAKQAETLRSAVGLDLGEFATKRAELYSKRTEIGRERDRLDAQANGIVVSVAHDEEPKDVLEIEARIKGCNAEFDKRRKLESSANDARETYNSATRSKAEQLRSIDKTKQRIMELEVQLASEKSSLETMQKVVSEADPQIAEYAELADKADEKLKEFKAPDLNTLTEELNSARAFNAEIEKAKAKRGHRDSSETKAKEFDDFTRQIEAVDVDRNKAISEAMKSFNVAGVSFATDGGLTVDGFPFRQGSSARRMEIATSIVLRMNPGIRVILIRDASLLDKDRMNTLIKVCKENNAQLWLERVGKGEECSVIIEDGEVEK